MFPLLEKTENIMKIYQSPISQRQFSSQYHSKVIIYKRGVFKRLSIQRDCRYHFSTQSLRVYFTE